MRKLVWEEDLEELDLGDGDFVTVSSQLTVKDMAGVSAGETQMQVSLQLLKAVIKSWRGPSFERNGEPVECTPENIERLSADVAGIISQHMAGVVSEEATSDEEKKESTPNSSPISTTP